MTAVSAKCVGTSRNRFLQVDPHYTSVEVSTLAPCERENHLHNCNPQLQISGFWFAAVLS